MKNRKLHAWLWRWHFIAGMVSLPFVLVLAITGGLYLFHPKVVETKTEPWRELGLTDEAQRLTYQEQWNRAKGVLKKPLSQFQIPDKPSESTQFTAGRFSHKTTVYIHPVTGAVLATFSPKDSWMYTVRKLHGELLGGKVGTKLVELVACWMVVLILSGLYIWWPFERGVQGVFTIRWRQGKRIFFRDIHAVIGFWMSGLLLLTLAGGLPWTDVFGAGFKKVQKWTDTGYPKGWNGRGLTSIVQDKPLTLDAMVAIAKAQGLSGTVNVGLPKGTKSSFSVSNKTFPLSEQKMLHFDQYSGALIQEYAWSDVGVFMRGRMWVMAFHQGQFGAWNWWLMQGVAIFLTLMSVGAIVSYLKRKPTKKLGVPKQPKKFKVGVGFVVLLLVLGCLLPLFGASIVFLFIVDVLRKRKTKAEETTLVRSL